MSSTAKVLGTIGALNTLIENFPMSILDLFKGKTYTSVFEFIIDVLYACGVPTNEIIEYLLDEIYSIVPDLENGLENAKEKLNEIDFTKVEQSEVLAAIESGIKVILNGLLASVYGCSSIPVLPNKVMDRPNNELFKGLDLTLWENIPNIYPGTFEIPIKMIDPTGLLELTPTSNSGRAYYDIPGSDFYYRKEKNENVSTFTFKRNVSYIDNPIIFSFKEKELEIKINNSVTKDIKIDIEYIKYNNLLKFNTFIRAGELICDKKLNIDSVNIIKNITINKSIGGVLLDDTIWCFLKRNNDSIFSKTIEWGEPKNEFILGQNSEVSNYKYTLLNDIPDDFKTAKRLNNVPTIVNENDADLIVVYDGMTPNELYKSNDMNAFIWYSIVRGSKITQIDKNLTMWDSRLSAQKKGQNRSSDIEWNNWYNSKKTNKSEFTYPGTTKITKESALYPILQLEKSDRNLYAIKVSFPSQRYFKPKYREKKIEDINSTPNKLEFNASIYKFNSDYIDNIQILKPKLLLTNFINYMLGFGLSTVNSINIDFTKKLIESKLSSAIEKIIEADDMEIEDCYTSFSNEEFDKMLEEMLYAKFTSTYYGGETNKLKAHDIESYLALIDSYNTATTREESLSKLTRLVNEVIVTPSNEGSISYGINASIDNNLLKKLLWAITMPIMESLFTPQVMLLMVINMSLMGIVKLDDFLSNDFSKILNLILNKILGLTKAIVRFIKDVIVEILFKLFLKKITPLLIKYTGALTIEKLEYWLNLLTAALKCLPKLPNFNLGKNYKNYNGLNDVVNYVDIIHNNEATIPESVKPC